MSCVHFTHNIEEIAQLYKKLYFFSYNLLTNGNIYIWRIYYGKHSSG